MRHYKQRLIAGLIILLTATTPLVAQQLTTVAVVNIQRVYDGYYRGGGVSSATNTIRQRYQQRINEQRGTLNNLNSRRREAQSANNQAQITEIEREIQRINNIIRELTQQQNEELRKQQQNRLPNTFVQNLQRAIVYVAESQGYTLVLRADDQGLQWWSPVVDITEEVLARLLERY